MFSASDLLNLLYGQEVIDIFESDNGKIVFVFTDGETIVFPVLPEILSLTYDHELLDDLKV